MGEKGDPCRIEYHGIEANRRFWILGGEGQETIVGFSDSETPESLGEPF